MLTIDINSYIEYYTKRYFKQTYKYYRIMVKKSESKNALKAEKDLRTGIHNLLKSNELVMGVDFYGGVVKEGRVTISFIKKEKMDEYVKIIKSVYGFVLYTPGSKTVNVGLKELEPITRGGKRGKGEKKTTLKKAAPKKTTEKKPATKASKVMTLEDAITELKEIQGKLPEILAVLEVFKGKEKAFNEMAKFFEKK